MKLELTFKTRDLPDSIINKLTDIQSMHPFSGLSAMTIVITTQDMEHIIINCGGMCVINKIAYTEGGELVEGIEFDLIEDVSINVA